MNKRQALAEALDIAAALIWQETDNPTEIGAHISDGDLLKVHAAMRDLAVSFEVRLAKLKANDTLREIDMSNPLTRALNKR